MIEPGSESQKALQALIEQWLKQEDEGLQFPVDFDVAWKIAGYSRKDSAKRKLNKLKKGFDYSTEMWKNPQGGRFEEIIKMTCDAFKHFCLLAETDEGRQIRQYFIECEKKLRLTEKAAADSNTLKNLIRQGLESFIENEIFSMKLHHDTNLVKPSIQQISELFDIVLTKTPEYEVTNNKLLTIAHYYPELKAATHVVSIVNRAYSKNGALLTVADLTEIIKQRYPRFPYWNNGLIQIILRHGGFQDRAIDSTYVPTEKGKRFSDWVDGQLLWYSDILCVDSLVKEFTRLNESD